VAVAADSDQPLRIVVNCAGIGPSARTISRTGPHDPELFKRVVTVNLIGTFNVLSIAADAVARTDPDDAGQRGVIVNTASVAAFEGQIGQIAYASSKAGVVGITLPTARDLSGVGIRVCTIAPGIVHTPMLATISEEYRAGLAASVPSRNAFAGRTNTPSWR
jgi:NAD(P)-dependent dehydrogenase (short-subunit alcohol dehydrogenase family)